MVHMCITHIYVHLYAHTNHSFFPEDEGTKFLWNSSFVRPYGTFLLIRIAIKTSELKLTKVIKIAEFVITDL